MLLASSKAIRLEPNRLEEDALRTIEMSEGTNAGALPPVAANDIAEDYNMESKDPLAVDAVQSIQEEPQKSANEPTQPAQNNEPIA